MKNKNYPLYENCKISNLKDFLMYGAEKYTDKTEFVYAKNRKQTIEVSYGKFLSDAQALGTVFYDMGFKDCNIAVLGENSYEWILTFFSVVNGGNVIVPIDKGLSSKEIGHLLTDSNCKVIVFSDSYADVIEELKEGNFQISNYINMKLLCNYIEKGMELIKSGDEDYIKKEVEDNQLASIVYTSGTTGVRKGVTLSHKNLASDVCFSCENFLLEGDTVLLLPLHHTFGLVAGIGVAMYYGYSIYINKSLKNVSEDILKTKPQTLFLVPLFIETLYKKVWQSARESGKERLLKTLIKISNGLLKIGIDVRRKLFKSVLDGFGGNLEFIISGGAPISNKYVKGFSDFGITVLNGYGITECSPVVAVNRNKYIREESVGQALRCCQVKISNPNEKGEGEICIKGDIVMLGYYNNPKATEEVIKDGFFKTGDIGKLDKDNFLYVTGRIKNLIILSNGENIAAEELEKKILDIQYVKEAIVYGENTKITAEMCLDEECKSKSREDIKVDINKINMGLPSYKKIMNIKIRDTEFPKTTTKKIIRN